MSDRMHIREKKQRILQWLYKFPDDAYFGPTEIGERALDAPIGAGSAKSQKAINELYRDGELVRNDEGRYQISKRARKRLSAA